MSKTASQHRSTASPNRLTADHLSIYVSISIIIGEETAAPNHAPNYQILFNIHNPNPHHRDRNARAFLLTCKSKTPRPKFRGSLQTRHRAVSDVA